MTDVTRRAALGVAVGGAVWLSGSPTATAQATRQTAGMVDTLKGAATAAVATESRPLAQKSPIFIADLIKTGVDSRMAVKLGARTTLRLGAMTELKIEQYLLDAGGDIELLDGAMQFERTGPRAQTELKFRSAYGLIAVRGTRFWAGPSQGAWGVLVGHGVVAVTGGGKTVLVRANQGTQVMRPGGEPSAPKPWGALRVDAALRMVR